MKSTFRVLFYLKKGSEKKNGEVMIMARITIDGKLCQFSTKQSILPNNWNVASGKAKGKDAGKINALLDDIRSALNTIIMKCNGEITMLPQRRSRTSSWGIQRTMRPSFPCFKNTMIT